MISPLLIHEIRVWKRDLDMLVTHIDFVTPHDAVCNMMLFGADASRRNDDIAGEVIDVPRCQDSCRLCHSPANFGAPETFPFVD